MKNLWGITVLKGVINGTFWEIDIKNLSKKWLGNIKEKRQPCPCWQANQRKNA